MAFMHLNWRHWYFSNVKNTPFLHVKFYLQIYKERVTNSTLLVVQAAVEMFWRWKLILPFGIWWHGRLMEESVSKVRFILELANPFIPVSKSIMLFLSKSMFLMISLSGLSFTIFFFSDLRSHWARLTKTCFVIGTSSHCCGCPPKRVFTPADHGVPVGRPRLVSS